ncbi:hypothetical protein GGR50DRAFT_237662 [Xylaria sp. CBS 124048]|nr:hypothetical protein GGR50DRAFT_237662 [Xylaria sp. CBS 124048]
MASITVSRPRYLATLPCHVATASIASSQPCNLATASQPGHGFATSPRLYNPATVLQPRHGFTTRLRFRNFCNFAATLQHAAMIPIDLSQLGNAATVSSQSRYNIVAASSPPCNLGHGFAASSRSQIASSWPRNFITALLPCHGIVMASISRRRPATVLQPRNLTALPQPQLS